MYARPILFSRFFAHPVRAAPENHQMSFLFVLPSHCPGVADHPSVTPGAPLRTPKQPKIPLKQPYFDQQSFLGKEGNCPLNTINWKVFLIFTTPLPSFGGASLIHHPIGPSQSPKATKSTTQTIRFGSAIFFVGKARNSTLETTKCPVFLICPTLSPC